jgi:hypothetical protein
MRYSMKLLNSFSYIICFLFYATVLPLPHSSAADNTLISASKGENASNMGEMVYLRWKNLGEGIIYQFQMARDREFQQIVIDQKCEKPEIALPQPDTSGIYYVRTRPLDPNGTAGNFSPVQTYEFSLKLQAPSIILPEEISEFRDIHDTEVRWSKVPRAAVYHVILARDRIFKDIFYENTQVPDTSLHIRNLDYGTYYIKVRAVSKEGKEGPFSDTRPFIIVPPTPRNFPVRQH